MTKKSIYKDLNVALANVLKEEGLEGLRTVYREVESIYTVTLREQKLDHTISIYEGRGCSKNVEASEKNIKKMRKKKNEFFLFADKKADEYYLKGRSLKLRKKEFDLLFCFIKDPQPVQKPKKEIYIDVWKEGVDKIPEGKDFEKDFHVLLAALRKHLRQLAGKDAGTIIKCWPPSPKHKESRWSINPDLSYCVIYD